MACTTLLETTPEQNLQVVRNFYDALANGDWPRAEQGLDAENLEVIVADSMPYGGVWKGIAGFRTLIKFIFASWESLNWKMLDYATGSNLVVAHFHSNGIGKNGMAFSAPAAEFWRFHNGKAVELRAWYWDTHRMRQAAGL
jgi:ketosteroid isomerase-like protein